MARQSYLFTSESVSEGHPDKVCDRISDEIVDLMYREAVAAGMNPWTVRAACETLTTTNKVVIAGEVRAPENLMDGAGGVNPEKFIAVAREAIKSIGYEQDGFHWQTACVDVLLHGQSADIAQGVDKSSDGNAEGACDQGIFRQGYDQGRSFGGLCGALSCEKRGCGGACGPMHHPAFLRHRRRTAIVHLCRSSRHRPC